MSFQLVPKSVTLNDLEWRNSRCFALLQRIRVASGAHCVKVHVRYLISWGVFSCAGCLHAACAGARMAWRPWQSNALNASPA